MSSAPYCDINPEENIRIVFSIAQEFECPVDFHLGNRKKNYIETKRENDRENDREREIERQRERERERERQVDRETEMKERK